MALSAAILVLALSPARLDDAAVAPELQLKIDRAIRAGVVWLEEEHRANPNPDSNTAGYPFGESCLKLYTLLVSGAPKDDPIIAALVEDARRAATEVNHTYTLSLAAMGLATHDRREHGAIVAGIVDRLDAGQIKQGDKSAVGAWGYTLPRSRTDAPGGPVVEHPAAHWDLPDGWWDDSNTQYAVLALRTVADFGFRADRRVFQRSAEHFVSRQNNDGGFSYQETHRPSSYTAMTAGAAGSLIMCADMLRDGEEAEDGDPGRSGHEEREINALRRRMDSAVQRGDRWMGKNLRFPMRDAPWPFYSAYAVERMGHFAQTPRFGKLPWYVEGAEWLISIQSRDGSWVTTSLDPPGKGRRPPRADFTVADYGSVVDTCFALLFLKRSSYVHTMISDEITVLLRNLNPQASAADLAKIKARILVSGKAGIPQLIKALYFPVRAARHLAAACLQELTGEDMGMLEAEDDDAVRRAREDWVRWLFEHPEFQQ